MAELKEIKVAKGRDTVVFSGEQGPVILSGGVPVTLAMSCGEGKTSIAIRLPSGETSELASGSSDQMASAYARLCRDLTERRRRLPVLPTLAGATLFAAASFVSGWILSSVSIAEVPVATQPSIASPAGGILQVPGIIPALEDIAKRAEADMKAKTASPGEIQKRPWFLVDPGPATAQPPSAADDKFSGLPPYKHAAPESTDSLVASEPDKEASESASPSVGAAAAKPEKPIPSATQAASQQQEAAPTVAGPNTGSVNHDKVKADAKSAVDSLIEKGMTPDEALDVLQKLEDLGRSDFTEITPEMLAGLPHEVANMLVQSGLVGQDIQSVDAPGGIPYGIIRLPESVIDKHRGEDGIASIPERNSWISTGNSVSIPLPGGGDVKTPEDLKEFSLKP